MPNAPPNSLTAAHLLHALLPDDQDGKPVDARLHYQQVLARLDGQLAIADLWKARVAAPPAPEEPQTLQELVQIARRRLRSERLREDTEELQARKWVVGRVIEELNQ